jgi:hypothetical protein
MKHRDPERHTACRHPWHVGQHLRASAVLLAFVTLALLPSQAASQPTPVQPGGGFAASYPAFTGAPGAMTAQQYVTLFNAAYHNPNAFDYWIAAGTDIRKLNPKGVYLKHMNLRTIVSGPVGPAEGHPDYDYIKRYHPEWIIKDRSGKPITLFVNTYEALDFGNDAFLDWVLNIWMPEQYFDETDQDPNRVMWYLHDNGNFDRMYLDCAPADPVCNRYNTDEGVRTAWENMIRRFKARYPNKRLVISSGPVTYKTIAEQTAIFQRILSRADGYFGETLTNDFAYFNDQPSAGKRTALLATMQLASWLADTNKVFFPNVGMTGGPEPTQSQMDYAWAFFNLLRKGDWQFFSRVTKDTSGNWVPRKYAEMTLPLGQPAEPATEQQPNVWRRAFTNAIAYVNLSDTPVSISLPPGGPFKNSLGQTVSSPLTLTSFSGLTVYRSTAAPAAPQQLQAK